MQLTETELVSQTAASVRCLQLGNCSWVVFCLGGGFFCLFVCFVWESVCYFLIETCYVAQAIFKLAT